MRYDPTASNAPAPEPVPKLKRTPKPEKPTRAMLEFAAVSDGMVKLMAPCAQCDVARIRADFTEHLRVTGDTEWRYSWQTWRSATAGTESEKVSTGAGETTQATPAVVIPLPPAHFPACPPASPAAPAATHPWLARFQRRQQLGMSLREPGTFALA